MKNDPPRISRMNADKKSPKSVSKNPSPSVESAKSAVKKEAVIAAALIKFRPYQLPIFLDRSTGVQIIIWSRQIGKSYTLAAWAVDRLLTRPGRLVTVLSNSRDNGGEFAKKCAEVCDQMKQAYEKDETPPDVTFDNMKFEIRITVNGKVGRIKVLAANPRTARGFSGDLIMDEFAFHENSAAIWEAAEPILSSHPDYLCRIASTPNGKHNMFYRMVTGGQFTVSRVTRTEAHAQGVKVYDPVTRKPITPAEARAKAMDKKAYDQNYELIFADENSILLTQELISQAEEDGVGIICENQWSTEALTLCNRAIGPLHFGCDVGRVRDLTVITVIESLGRMRLVRAVLRIQGMRLPDQQKLIELVCRLKQFRGGVFDMTGIGLGLCEYTQEKFGQSRIRGVNFSSTVPLTNRLALEGRTQEKVRVTEAMATELLHHFEDRLVKIPVDAELRDDLRKPEKIVSPGGKVSIAATRDEAGHADHFWSLALAIDAATASGGPFAYEAVQPTNPDRPRIGRPKGILL